MSDLWHSLLHMFDNVSAGTLQLTAILGVAFVYFGYSYWFGEGNANANAVASQPSATQQKPAKRRLEPLRDDEVCRKAHKYFKQHPVLTVSSGCLLTPGNALSPQIADVLREAANVSKVHVIVHETGSSLESAVRDALQQAGLVGTAAGQVPSHRILPCTTTAGKVAIVRQIEPALHLESDAAVSSELLRFNQRVNTLPPPPAGNDLCALVMGGQGDLK